MHRKILALPKKWSISFPGEIKSQFAVEIHTVLGKMKRMQVCIINNGIKVKFWNILAVVNKPN